MELLPSVIVILPSLLIVALLWPCLTVFFFFKYITMETMYANSPRLPKLDYLGSNIVQLKGVGPYVYLLTLFQSLVTEAGYDPVRGPGSSCSPSGQCVVPWGRGTKAVSSVVLVANGVSFAVSSHTILLGFYAKIYHHCKVMTAIFTIIGSAADYGNFGRWLLLIITCVCWAAQFASMSLTSACLIKPPRELTALNHET